MPAVSVIIPAWRAGAFIHRAIESLRGQSLADFEAIVVDDASPDDTVIAAQRAIAGDPRFEIIRLPRNGGVAAARNAGIDRATGEFIAVLDADDWMTPQRLETMTAAARALGADILADHFLRVHEPDSPPAVGLASAPVWEIGLAEYIRRNKLSAGQRALGYLKPIFRRDFIERFQLRQDPLAPTAEDFLFVADALAHDARFFQIPEQGYFYWVRNGSISRTPTSKDIIAWIECDARYRLRHQGRLPADAIDALDQRLRQIKNAKAYYEFKEAVFARRPGEAAKVLLTPSALFWVRNALGFHIGRIGRNIAHSLRR